MHTFGTDISSTIRVMVMPPKIGMVPNVSDTSFVGFNRQHILLCYQSHIKNFIIYIQNICIHSKTPTDYVNDYKIRNTSLTCGVKCLEY